MECRDPSLKFVAEPACCSSNRAQRRVASARIAIGAACCAVCVCTQSFAQEPPVPPAPPPTTVPSQTVAIKPPEVIKRVDALYPPEAFAARKEANVILHVTVDAAGAVAEVEVLESGGADFDQAAIAAVRAWRFQPARKGEEPVASRIRI